MIKQLAVLRQPPTAHSFLFQTQSPLCQLSSLHFRPSPQRPFLQHPYSPQHQQQVRFARTFTMSNINNISGEYIPTPLSKVLYGRGTIQSLPALLSELNAKKAFIVTGSSLHSKTP